MENTAQLAVALTVVWTISVFVVGIVVAARLDVVVGDVEVLTDEVRAQRDEQARYMDAILDPWSECSVCGSVNMDLAHGTDHRFVPKLRIS